MGQEGVRHHQGLPLQVRQVEAWFGDSKWGHIPEIEMLHHRLDELRVQPETREQEWLTAFLWGCTEQWGPWSLRCSGLEIGRLVFLFMASKYRKRSGNKSSRERTQADYLTWSLARLVQFWLRQRHMRITALPQKISRTPRQDQVHQSMRTAELQS